MKYELYDGTISEQDHKPNICQGCNQFHNTIYNYCPNCRPSERSFETNKSFSLTTLEKGLGKRKYNK
ncbi:MAG: hypothetical protein ACFFDN_00340 [Candidatus Hodarchaeota archaeon]